MGLPISSRRPEPFAVTDRQDLGDAHARNDVDDCTHLDIDAKINEAVEQHVRPHVLVLRFHMPAAIAANIPARLDLNRRKPRPSTLHTTISASGTPCGASAAI
jgi:hypothetical protein